jgi:tRNA-dihydrouridine synthase A
LASTAIESYGFVRDFVGTVADAGCEVFIVHARNAWLQGLSPKENREIPPLRYERGVPAQARFPQLTIVPERRHDHQRADRHRGLQHVDGVMVGREAYHNPWWLDRLGRAFFGAAPSMRTPDEVEAPW